MDATFYEKMTNAFNLLKLLVPAEEDVSNERDKEARAFFEEFKRDKKNCIYRLFMATGSPPES
jgi:hypothetical protein